MIKKCLVALCFILLAKISFATTDSFSLINYHPASGLYDFIFSMGSPLLDRYEWQLYSELDYGYHPFEINNDAGRVGGITDHLLIQHIGGSFSPTAWWQVDLDMPIAWMNKFATPSATPGVAELQHDLGDFLLRNRFSILSREKYPVGLAIVPFVTIPVGNENHLVGDNLPTGGGWFVADANLGNQVSLSLNVGFEAREKVELLDLDFSHRLLASIGLNIEIMKNLEGEVDIYVATPLSHFFEDKIHTQSELALGFDYTVPNTGFRINFGGGLSLVRGAGVPLVRSLVGFSYIPP